MTMVGASLLWFGWFGFNAGSALEANGSASLAFLNTYLATACAVLVVDVRRVADQGQAVDARRRIGRGRRTGRDHAGLRQRRHDPGAFMIGFVAGFDLPVGRDRAEEAWSSADDSLDVFGVHAVGGITGALLTGIFNAPSLGGPGSVQDWVTGATGYPGMLAQLWIQAKAVGITVVWTAVVALIAFKIADLVVGLRVTEEQEREGLDISSHGESAYDM